MQPIPPEISARQLKKMRGRRVEVVAFGISYRGRLEKIDLRTGTIRIVDRRNYAVLELERIESFQPL